MVVLLHFYTPNGLIWSLAVVQGGWLWVDFFFVLSGFVIFASYGERLRSGFAVGRFLWLRLGRIYPLHLAVLAAFLAYELLIGLTGWLGRAPFAGDMRAADLVPSLLLVQVFIGDSMAWNAPAWSIAVEIWVYLLAALLLAFAGRLFWPSVVLLVAAAAIGLALDSRYLVQLGELTALRGWYGFGLGMIALALFRRRGGGPRLTFARATALEIALVAGGVLFLSLARDGGWPSMLAPPAFAIGVFVFAAQAGAVSRLLLAAPLRTLGLLSYSIYLTHMFVLDRLHDAVAALDWPGLATVGTHASGDRFVDAAPLVSDLLTALFLAAVVALSWLTCGYIERPAREWSRRAAKRRAAAGAAAAAAAS